MLKTSNEKFKTGVSKYLNAPKVASFTNKSRTPESVRFLFVLVTDINTSRGYLEAHAAYEINFI